MQQDSVAAGAARPKISIIIPTACEAARRELIGRALRSIRSQHGVTLEIVVVVNGKRFDGALLEELKAAPDLVIIQLDEGNVSAARHQGVVASRGELFCFLDDDDEFLPGAMDLRAALCDRLPHVDVLVTNGYMFTTKDQLLVRSDLARRVNGNPGMTFLESNWFASPGSTYRRASVPASLFDFRLRFFEWTYLFFSLLSKDMTIHFDERLTYRKHEDNPMSVSKTDEYLRAHPAFFETLLGLPLKGDVRAALEKKRIVALNALSNHELRSGRRLAAWRAHIACLAAGGWQYLAYTRHLALPGRPAAAAAPAASSGAPSESSAQTSP